MNCVINFIVMSYSHQLRDLHYSHDSINCTFKDGTPLTKLCEDFLSGRVTLDTLPRLGVKHIHNKNFVMDGNRRLFVLRMLQNHGMLPRDTVRTVPYRDYKKITAKRTFRIRNDPQMYQKINDLIVEHKRRKREEEAKKKEEERAKQKNMEEEEREKPEKLEEQEKLANLEEEKQENPEKLEEEQEEPAKLEEDLENPMKEEAEEERKEKEKIENVVNGCEKLRNLSRDRKSTKKKETQISI